MVDVHPKPDCPKPGNGRFQWNAGGWFGGLFGASFYMLVGGVAFLANNLLLAVVWLTCFVLTVSIGIYIWTRRQSFAPYPAMQCLLLVVAVFSAIVILSAYMMAPQLLALVQLSPGGALGFLLLVPGLMIWFHVLEMLARR